MVETGRNFINIGLTKNNSERRMAANKSYQLTPEQRDLAVEIRDLYNRDVDSFLAAMKEKLEHPTKYGWKTIQKIKKDLPQIKKLKQIDDNLKGMDPDASITDLL